MRYTPKFFNDTMPEWKRKKDSIVARYIHRPISFIFSSIFAEIGLTPNQVSFISLIVAVIACSCFLVSNKIACIIGAIMVNLWSIMDSADGNMARSIGGKPYGDFIDATSSYFLVGFMLPALGWSVYCQGGFIFQKNDGLIVLIGAIAGISDTMMRLFYQKMKCNSYELQNEEHMMEYSQNSKSKLSKIHTIIESELGLGGWNMIAILMCALTTSFDLYIIFYLVFYGGMFLSSTVYLIKKTGCLRF